jgi:D-sedoheptulose 7-phosphate isomerase
MTFMNVKNIIENHEHTVQLLKEHCIPTIENIAKVCCEAIRNKHKIIFCGNGGSAADSQHLAAEFVGRFIKERRGLPAIALTTDTSILTAVGNDYGYDEVFRRQVEALAVEGDVLIGISTSGNSGNVVRAFEQAKKQHVTVIAFTGAHDSKMSNLADITLQVPSTFTAHIQECHILVGHIICNAVDELY